MRSFIHIEPITDESEEAKNNQVHCVNHLVATSSLFSFNSVHLIVRVLGPLVWMCVYDDLVFQERSNRMNE